MPDLCVVNRGGRPVSAGEDWNVQEPAIGPQEERTMLEPSAETVPPPQPQPSPHKRGALETAAYVAVIVGVIAFLGDRAL